MEKKSVCMMLLFVLMPNGVLSFSFLRELIFPRTPMLNRVRAHNEARSSDRDYAVLDFMGLVAKHGYTAEEHKVVTRDGYNLRVHRIPGTPTSPPRAGKPAVFLQHGVFGSSDHWVLMGPEKDLAFMLADGGYDVWMGNVRGNTYSRAHEELSPSDEQFWQFSYHEMSVYDLPAMIDYTLKVSGEKAVHYVGHSMGTTMTYVLLSTMPEYNEKIKLAVSLAPVALWKVQPTIPMVVLMEQNFNFLKGLLDMNNIAEIFPQTTNNARLARGLCSDGTVTQSVCLTLMSVLSGHDPHQLNSTLLPYYLSYFPAGASTQTLYHYAQNIRTGAFQQYDHGYIENFKLYGKKRPPSYDVKKITAPFALIYGANDPLTREENTNELARRLQNVVTVEKVPYKYFNHIDFIWALDARELLYNRIMELLEMY
ncbi:lipase 3 [Diachasma alloeum]|uniref:lipase 3 n=1 Tax=Diachasma alloeum TaxID=454923 RepID=UPI0007381B17|nr:lipase 3 [Diachasma alloeum]XP_015112845.1 lipase 3 [Diachasma alloeum]XP_015112846.1 lipase 3 [Diachasma alloeum]